MEIQILNTEAKKEFATFLRGLADRVQEANVVFIRESSIHSSIEDFPNENGLVDRVLLGQHIKLDVEISCK